MRGELHIITGNRSSRIIPLDLGTYGIGRSKEMAIQIESRQVSRHHAEIIVENDQVRLLDCGSANGTELNGKLITTGYLRDGDRIRVGEVTIQYRAPLSEQARAARNLSPQPRIYSVASTVLADNLRKRPIRSLFTGMFILVFATLLIASAWMFKSLLHDRLTVESVARAQAVVKYLAEKNKEDLRLGNKLLLDIGSVSKEKGIKAAYIIDDKGKVLAPISEMDKTAKDPFTTEALAQNSDQPIAPSPALEDGSRIFVHPIRVYDDTSGHFTTLGVAKIIFSAQESVGPLSEVNRLFGILFILAILLAVFLGWATSRMITNPLLQLAERIHQWRAGQVYQKNEPPFKDWGPLYEAVDLAVEELEQ